MRLIAVLGGMIVLGASPFGTSWSVAVEPNVRVMTFNVRYATAPDGDNAWPKRKTLLIDTVRKFDPDLLGTQEVLALQADYLAESLSDYKLVGVGRDDGKRRGEYSAILFKTARFELVDSGTFWLSETPDVPGSKSWDSALPRVATWARLRDRSTGAGEICYLNTHWDHQGNRARIESAKIIRHWLSEHAAGVPTIVTGDLNVTEDHEGYRTLIDQQSDGARLHDVFRQVHPQVGSDEASFHAFSGKRQGRRIDFILATPQFKATEAAIDTTNDKGRYPSDHFPVTAVLQVAR